MTNTKRRTTSPIWKHFRRLVTDESIEPLTAKCLHCNHILSIKSGSMGNLWRHFKKIHPVVYSIETIEKISNREGDDMDVINEGEVSNVWLEEHAYDSNTQPDKDEQEPSEVQFEIKRLKPNYTETKPKPKKIIYSPDYIQSIQMDDREFDAIGANVACKLKRMTAEQRCHAELLINKVLINGLKENLTDDTDLTEVYKA